MKDIKMELNLNTVFINRCMSKVRLRLVCTAGGEPGCSARQGAAAPARGSDSRGDRLLVGPPGGGATDAPLRLRSSCDLPGCLRLPGCIWSEAHGLAHA